MNKKDKQKHQANYSDVGRPGYINLQLLIIILTLSTIIGMTIGAIIYAN